MAKLFMDGEDIRKMVKTCYVCRQEITATQAFVLELAKETKYRHLDCGVKEALAMPGDLQK